MRKAAPSFAFDVNTDVSDRVLQSIIQLPRIVSFTLTSIKDTLGIHTYMYTKYVITIRKVVYILW